jgi:hypothetical protein
VQRAALFVEGHRSARDVVPGTVGSFHSNHHRAGTAFLEQAGAWWWGDREVRVVTSEPAQAR